MMSTGFGKGVTGVAILVTLLLSSALGTTWVDVEGGVTPDQAAGMPMSVPASPAGVVGTNQGLTRRPPSPELLPPPFNYVYLDPDLYSANRFPWEVQYSGFREQHLYLAGEIGRGGTIDQIALFKIYAYTYAATFPNVSVKMCHTNVTSLTGAFNDNYGGQTPVWVYHNDALVRGGEPYAWDAVDLQTPFDYNGTDNLLVEVLWQGTASGLGSYSWYNSVGSNRRAGAYNITDTLVAEADFTDRCFYNTRIGFRTEPNDVGVLSMTSPIEFVAFGDSVVTCGRVANFGSQPQTNVPVICAIYDSAAGERVSAETVYVASLDTGEVCTVTFPFWDPPVEDRVYLDTMMAVLQGDEETTNDWKVCRFTVADWVEGRLTYNDGESDGNNYTWVSPNYTAGVRFPGPCIVGRISVGLWAYPGSEDIPYPCTCKVRLNDGANGMPGTTAWEQPLMLHAGDSFDYINYIVLDPPAVVTADSFYVTWKPQWVANPWLSADSDEPIQIGNDFSTDPNSEVFYPLRIGQERDANTDLMIDAYRSAPLLDGSPKEIVAPQEQLDSGTTFIPQVVVKDYGLLDRGNIVTRFFITGNSDGGDTVYSGIANTGPIQAGDTQVVTFADSVTLAAGNYTMTSITLLPYDGRTANDTLVRPLSVGLGIADVNVDPGRPWVSIAPNPLGRHATVRYNLPKAGLATLAVFDVAGRTVLTQTLAAGRTGTASLDLRKLEAGVYLVKVTTEGFSSTQKLVVQR
jgi:hypothetical protein